MRAAGRVGWLLASCLAVGVAASGAGALAQDDEFFPLDPPLALPQQINGIVRASSREAPPDRIERIGDVFPVVRACWQPPQGRAGATGQQVTLRLSFNRSGQTLGQPRVTYRNPSRGNAELERRFKDSVIAALSTCTPLPFSKSFGAAIAGRPFTFRFIDDRPA